MPGLFETYLEGFATEEKPVGPNQYRCDMCAGVFDKAWTDEEAKAELGENFGDISTDDCGIVCDDCYKKMGFA